MRVFVVFSLFDFLAKPRSNAREIIQDYLNNQNEVSYKTYGICIMEKTRNDFRDISIQKIGIPKVLLQVVTYNTV